MFKGKILKFSGSDVIVLSDTLSYEKIKLKPRMKVGQIIYYFEEDLIVQTENTHSFIDRFGFLKISLRVAPILAVLLLAIMVFNNTETPSTELLS